ncbi:MAG: 50S ribosomal protein L6 [Deltaproteobacteria bacterium]|nr:50S ribosomal protein L6 [Deltaproteobacteria bacterium]
MSRVGKKPIKIPPGVKITRENSLIKVEGPKGTLTREIPEEIDIEMGQEDLIVKTLSDGQKVRSLHGLSRALIANMVTGVSEGFEKALEIVGVGYRGEVDGDILKLAIGYSEPVEYRISEGVSIKIEKLVNMVVSGIDKELVGKVAADIRRLKKPEPYKGKGIRYAGERIRRKVGKSAGA